MNFAVKYERTVDPDDRLVLGSHHDMGRPVDVEEYDFYEHKHANCLEDDCICILHNYDFRNWPNTDEFLIPNYVVGDVNAGLTKYHAKKHIHDQNILREYKRIYFA